MSRKIKLIIAGSRNISMTTTELGALLKSYSYTPEEIAEVVSGNARGMDSVGELWAAEHLIPVKRFKANWEVHGNIAGPLRNKEMAKYADEAFIVWDGMSSGSTNMLANMELLNKNSFIVLHNPPIRD